MNTLKINKDNVFSILHHLEYGENFVSFEKTYDINMLKKCIETINEIKGSEVLEMTAAVEDYIENQEYKQKLIDGVFRLLWRIRGEYPPELTLDDVSIEENAENAELYQCTVSFKINDGLLKKAKRIALKNGIKFISSSFGQSFNGQVKKMSVFKQLEKAHLDGIEKITFDTVDIATQTVRVYVSQLNSFYGKNYSVSVSEGCTTVYFMEKSKITIAEKRLKTFYNSIESEIGKPDALIILEKLILSLSVDPEKWKNIVDKSVISWKDLGESLKSIENNNPKEKFNIDNYVLADGKNTPLREVEGLQQYFLEELEVTPISQKFDTQKELNKYKEELKERSAELDNQFNEDDDF